MKKNRMFEQGATLFLSMCCVALLNSCGSGAVTATDPAAGTAMTVSPAIADVFPDIPTTYTIVGGTPAYSVFSSNSVALPLSSAVIGSSFTVVPSAVSVDTSIDITVRDAANTSTTARANIRPTTLINQITFTPIAPTGTGCVIGTGTGVCSGGDAHFVAKAVLNGVVLRARPIRFEVYLGSFQIVTPGTGILVNSLVVNTDEQGEAVIRITTPANVPTQTATLQTTDTTSGLSRRYNFTILQQTSGVGILSILPSTFPPIKGDKGPAGGVGLCPANQIVNFYVYGGTPPYSIVSPLTQVAFPVTNSVPASGGTATVAVNGCGKVALIVTDSRGLAIETPQIDGQQGDNGVTPTLTVAPTTVTLGCNQTASVNLVGTGTFSTNIVTAGASGTNFGVSPSVGVMPATVSFIRTGAGTVPTPITVNVVAGTTVVPVQVTLNNSNGGTLAGGQLTCP